MQQQNPWVLRDIAERLLEAYNRQMWDASDSEIENMKSLLSKHQKENNIGNFGGLFEIKGYKNPVLVSSTDGVGSKL